PEAELLKGVDSEKWGCATCHSFKAKTAGAVAPNLTKLADRCKFAGDIYTTDQKNLEDWVYNAPSMKPMGKLNQHMPNFSEQGMTKEEAASIAKFLLDNTNSG